MTTLSDGHQVTFRGAKALRMKDLRTLSEADKRADLNQLYPVVSRLIESWDYTDEAGEPLDPRDPASFDELLIDQFRELSSALGDYIQAEMAQGKN